MFMTNHISVLTERINALLPQTQCTRCGYDACLPYAEAIAQKDEAINRCPPGGEEGIQQLAALTGQAVQALNPECGTHEAPTVAWIDEKHCIGCTLCIQACPVDAILGANKRMHTVISDRCTGCDLCLAPCPVDCITMLPANREWTPELATAAKKHYEARSQRLQHKHDESGSMASRLLANKPKVALEADDPERRKASIAQALAQARARRAQQPTS